MFVAIGAQGNSLGPLSAALGANGFSGHTIPSSPDVLQMLVDWVSADRSGRGDAHIDAEPSREDGWLALR
jgi:hypothetical protein